MKGILFGNIHSFNDLDLFLNPFTPTPAVPKTNFLDIVGGNGSLDLTEALGEVHFNDREFTFTFTINPASKMTFDEKVTQVSNLLNGKRCNIVLERDADFYWEGRISINEYVQDRKLGQIVVKAIVKPYKMKQTITQVAFPLTSSEQKVTVQNSRKSVVPLISITQDAVIKVSNASYVLEKGTHEMNEIMLYEGENEFTVRGNGTMTFMYREGVL